MKKFKIFLAIGLTICFFTSCKENKTSTELVSEVTTQSESVVTFETTTEKIEEIIETTVEINNDYCEHYYYKPSTHYIHRHDCKWVDNTCYEIYSTEDIEARYCTDCCPDIPIIYEYIEPTEDSIYNDYDRQLLAEIVWHEAGSDWINLYDKAHVAAAVMNRVYDMRFPCTVYAVLTQDGQFTGYWPGCCTPTQDCYDAVDYYFSHVEEFDGSNSWYGDGQNNYFYYQ